MACLPQITGGRLFNAANAEQIGAPARGGAAACRQRCRPVAIQPAARGRRAAQPTPPPSAAAIPADGPPGLYLRALLAPKTEPVSLPLHWTVFAEGKPDAILFDARAANPYVAGAARTLRGRGARRARV